MDAKDSEKYSMATALNSATWKSDEIPVGDLSRGVSAEDESARSRHLTPDNFHSFIASGTSFVKFFVPWCPHCQKLAPTWEQLGNRTRVKLGEVDCSENKGLCRSEQVDGYPTLYLFKSGQKVEEYQGKKDLEDLVGEKYSMATALNSATWKSDEIPVGDLSRGVSAEDESARSRHLTPDNFHSFIASGTSFVKFFVPWCPHCQKLAPTWEQLGDRTRVKLGEVDCSENKGLCRSEQVDGYPTLYLFKSGQKVEEYQGKKDLEDLVGYLDSH